MKKLKISITGANGYIGKLLLKKLLDQGQSVKILTRDRTYKVDSNFEVFFGDLTDKNFDLSAFVADADILIHAAANLKDESLMRNLHVDAGIRLYETLENDIARRNRQVKWIQLSSVGAYGPPTNHASENRIISEDYPCSPKNEYEITKTEFDNWLLSRRRDNENIQRIILRPSIVYGPNMVNQSIKSFIKSIRKGLFFYIGKKGAIATYIHEIDVINAIIHCMEHEKATGVYNLSNDCKLEEMVEAIREGKSGMPFLRIPESFVRFLCRIGVFNLIGPNLLNEKRINSLVNRTSYKSIKIQEELGFTFHSNTAKLIGELAESFEKGS